MTFDNLCKIVDGERLNLPTVNAYEKIETEAQLIKQGDLFVGSDKTLIALAINNGAYAILHENSPHMIDEEVAWIKVDSTDAALIKILRFSLLKSDSLFFFFPPIEYAILKQIVKKEHMIFLDEQVTTNFKKILEAGNNSFFVSQNQDFLNYIYPEYITYLDKELPLIKITHQTLFLSSFTYQDIHYEDIKLPALFLPALNRVLHYLQESHLSFDIEKLTFLEHFKPLFISNRLTIRPFGHSEHAFIVEPNPKLINDSLHFIQTYAKWAEVLLFLPKRSTIEVEENILVDYYDDIAEIKGIEIDKFNFILIVANYNELSLILENKTLEKNSSLF